MVKVVKAPEEYKQGDACDIFLGGSIDMGSAENWQEKFINDFSEYENVVILNPRRDDWDSSWTQDPTPGTQFHEQVKWELDQQENADILVYYFAPDSKSPITLLELGLFGADNVIVCCPKEFYRYGNVKMICDRYNITIVESYEDMLSTIKKSLKEENIS
jgi:hypothetical protein